MQGLLVTPRRSRWPLLFQPKLFCDFTDVTGYKTKWEETMTACATACDSLPLATGKNFLCWLIQQFHSPPMQTNIWRRTNTYTEQYRPVISWPVLMNCIFFFFFNLHLSFCSYVFCMNCMLRAVSVLWKWVLCSTQSVHDQLYKSN